MAMQTAAKNLITFVKRGYVKILSFLKAVLLFISEKNVTGNSYNS